MQILIIPNEKIRQLSQLDEVPAGKILMMISQMSLDDQSVPVAFAISTHTGSLQLSPYIATDEDSKQRINYALAAALCSRPDIEITNIAGLQSDTITFANLYCELEGRERSWSQIMEMTGYQLTPETLNYPQETARAAQNQFRLAQESDIPILAPFLQQFFRDTGMVHGVSILCIVDSYPVLNNVNQQVKSIEEHELEAQKFIDSSNLWLWCSESTQEMLTLTAIAGTTSRGARIGRVFTPANARQQGAAFGCVASVCRAMFQERGMQLVYLFADTNSPGPNKLYRKVGFTPFGSFIIVAIH